MTRFATIAAAAAALLLGSTASAADAFAHFDRIAAGLEGQANRLASEVRHYRHTREYVHLIRDARTMAQLARHAHVTAHVGCNLAHLEADVRALDSALHHIQELVAHIDEGVAYGHGHVHGNAGHVHSLLHAMEINIHHLMSDLRQLRLASQYDPHRGHVGHGGYGGHGGSPPIAYPTINRRIPAGWGNGMTSGPTINRRIPAGWGNAMAKWPQSSHTFGWNH